jgi:hypothetical protein
MEKAQRERLTLLIEECAEVQHMACKALRHGMDSFNPFDPNKTSNKKLLSKEIGHLIIAIELCGDNEDLDDNTAEASYEDKIINLQQYLYYNTIE